MRFVLSCCLLLCVASTGSTTDWYPNSSVPSASWALIDGGPDDIGTQRDMIVDANGVPHIAYIDRTKQTLWYAFFDGHEWQKQYVDGPQIEDTASSPQLSAWGPHLHLFLEPGALPGTVRPVIFYRENSTWSLRCARKQGPMWTITPVYSNPSFTGPEAVARDQQGRYVITYSLNTKTGYDLYCGIWNGTTFTSVLVDCGGTQNHDVYRSNVAVDQSGDIHISYVDTTSLTLEYAKVNGATLSVVTSGVVVDGGPNVQVSHRPMVAFDPSGSVTLVYRKNTLPPELRLARLAGGSWNVTTLLVDTSLSVTAPKDMVSDGNGVLYLAFAYNHGASFDAYLGTIDLAASSMNATPVVLGKASGRLSVDLDPCGYLHYAYYDWPATDLAYIRQAGMVPYGQGCTSSAGCAPTLSGSGCLQAGGLIGIKAENAPSGATAVVLFGAGTGAGGPAACPVQVLPLLPVQLSLPLSQGGSCDGTASIVGFVPAGLAGAKVSMQVLVPDAATPTGYAATNPLLLDV